MRSRDSEQVVLLVYGVRTLIIALRLCPFENYRSRVIQFQCYFLCSEFLRLYLCSHVAN